MMKHSLIVLLLVCAACTFDEDPDFFIDNMRPDLYFSLPVPQEAVSATVTFVTKKPSVAMPLNVRILAWTGPSSNIYDGSLEDTLLERPTERKTTLLWGGTVIFPMELPGEAPYANRIGVELRTFMPISAYNGPALSGEFCEADFMGAGITGCGQWFEVFVNLWAVCRAAAGHLVDCFGTGYTLLPKVMVTGFFEPQGVGMSRTKQEQKRPPGGFFTMQLSVYRDVAGWYYKPLSRDDFYTPGTFAEKLASRPTYGPFQSPELAVRDAVRTLDLDPDLLTPGFAEELEEGTELRRAVEVLEELLAAKKDDLRSGGE